MNRRHARRAELVRLLGGCCSRCPTSSDLHFDHIVPGSKKFGISQRGLDKPWAELIAEVQKCQLLCPPCHREKTVEAHETMGGWNKGIRRAKNTKPAHGTPARYSELQCRCTACVDAKRKYRSHMIPYAGADAVTVDSTVLARCKAKKQRSNKAKQRSLRIDSLGIHKLDVVEALESVHALRPKKQCLCGAMLSRSSLTYCSQACRVAYQKPSGRSRRPDKKQLMEVVSGMSLCAAGRHFGVSDSAVRKWLKSYELL